MRPRAVIGLALMVALSQAAAAEVADPAGPGRHELNHQGIARSYVVRLPANPPAGARLPLVLVLHGGGGDAASAEKMTGFTDKGRREGFIVVYPEGSGRFANRLLTWNAGHCCGQAMQRRVDDVGFFRTLIDRLVADYPVDARRVYATGISNGGMMSHRLGIELPDKLAAIAPVVATLFGDEKRPAQGVSALMINGALDASVPAAGGAPGGRFPDSWDGTPALPSTAQGRFWAEANGCAASPETIAQGPVQRARYRCPAGRDVELLLVADNPHAWPGGVPGSRLGATPSTAINATDEIWAFFKAHAR
ncbi:alpha/beta hydrolase family esterase [Ideonella sp.]|uniref:extracellular catalytic domain type 1 short-chain-length polyhydroxyalkanoate depolymerase n=1 Tax=Ideonella sp. TaxID=1929293 RepID=UPI002B48535A|nr:PHB depolymerase family esterase [Ideonella sp.]HJV68656.1 PHB depolymerase family esterase [Ideonella sp.]